ncbi:endolytic transglycosylase MltG [Streptomyces halobius]|uniref:Endolytic murein transglycosylase n=1 Tax=Streptomyces halobius TaxID=2879846 RepID=A0ABY4MG89_9ACTN|nr:endolytic transglycosylase MltG [Streptomyces halobius]UQA96513.1 endolytic transglycosylase MltG [Streptomyces halobius]
MTEYGRGYGSEPWHPEDPLYGDQGSYGGQAQQAQWGGAQSAPYPQQHYGGGWDGSQGGQPPHDPYDPYGPQADPYSGAGTDYYGAQDAYAPHPQRVQQQAPLHPQQHQVPHQRYPSQQYEQYETPVEPQFDDTAGDDWQDGPQPREREPEHPFFADDDEDDGRSEPGSRERRSGRERRGKKNKRRSGRACLVITLVFAGAVGTVGYFGYDFFMSHFGPAPDYEGQGSGDVQVEIPPGSTILQMGLILKKEGVVKSADAFTEAAVDSKKDKVLQPGTYSLRKRMSAAAAVELMVDPKSRNGLTVREGLRAAAVYELIDKKLKLKAGTTKGVAKSQAKNLGLPSWANDSPKIKDPLEGFLYPSTYSVGDDAKPADVLKMMVGRATQEYGKYDLEANARKLHLKSPLQLITVASLTQAEGMTHDDFRKMAAVVYNRLAPGNTDTNQKLEFDSAFNYLKNQSKIDISADEIRSYDDPYNTYFYRGLPPGPIGNPGADALRATINPDTTKKWLYFISIDQKKTDFTTNFADHQKLVREFNKRRQEQRQNGN